MNLPISGTALLNKLDWLRFKSRQSLDLCFLPVDFLFDALSFWFHSRLSIFGSRENKMAYDLVFFAHTIEKGLSLPDPRSQFGRSNIARVIRILKGAKSDILPDFAIAMGMGSLNAYLKFHFARRIESDFISELSREMSALKEKYPNHGIGGTKDVRRVLEEVRDSDNLHAGFLLSRYSCRTFRNLPVERELIAKLARTAQQAPSQCNRQSVRLHVYQDPKLVSALLEQQGGARGFSHQVPVIVVITSDVCAWMSRAERNQGYVDAGIYAMAFLLACHAFGLGACPLNFSKTFLKEYRFRKTAKIPSNERVTLLVAIGWPDTDAKAACSARRGPEEVLTFHEV